MTGVLLIALKSPLYGRMAYNLMQSIKAVAPDMPVSIVGDDAGLQEIDAAKLFYFDKVIQPKPEQYIVGGKVVPLVCKFALYDLTPYDKTLFLDADTILSTNSDLRKFLADLDGIGFTMANRGEDSDTSQWVNMNQVKATFNPSKWYDLSSELIYFEKGDTAKKIFKSARKFYDEGKLQTRPFAGDKPDEPFFGLAMAKHETYPHQSPWKPLFWMPQETSRHYTDLEIHTMFLGMSAGGRFLPKRQLKLYSQMCGAAAFKTGVALFPYLHKHRYLPERKDI